MWNLVQTMDHFSIWSVYYFEIVKKSSKLKAFQTCFTQMHMKSSQNKVFLITQQVQYMDKLNN